MDLRLRWSRGAAARVLGLALGVAAAGCGLRGSDPAKMPALDPLVARLVEVGEAGIRRPRQLVWVSIAGLPVEAALPEAGEGGHPLLATLVREGVAALRVEGVTPASSYPAHATLVTGRAPSSHGIVADRLLGPRGVRRERPWHVSLLREPTLWQIAADRGLSVAALDWPTTLGAELDELLPDVLATTRGGSWLELLEEGASPWLLERAREAPPEVAVPGPERDAFLVGAACTLLMDRPPAFLLLRLSQANAPLVRAGPDAEETREALARAISELARLLACVDRAGRLGELSLVVTGDRRALPVHTEIRPNTALREADLLSAPEGLVDAWIAYARSNGASAFVYAESAEAAVAARRVLAREAASTRAFRIVSAEEMIASGADPDAWFGLEAREGWHFDDAAAGPLLVPSEAAGSDGEFSAANSGGALLLWGAGVARGVRIPVAAQVDVAPTLSVLIGTSLEETEGRALLGALALPRIGAPSP